MPTPYNDFFPRDLIVLVGPTEKANILLWAFREASPNRDIEAYAFDLEDLNREAILDFKRRGRDAGTGTVLVFPATTNASPTLMDMPESLEVADLILALGEDSITAIRNRSGATGTFSFPEGK